MTNKFRIATDCDDVLVNTAGKWVRGILSDDSIISKIPSDALARAAERHPMNREEFEITSHFGTNQSWLTPELKRAMLDKFFLDSTFYDNLPPSSYAKVLRTMCENDLVESVWVITSCVDLKYPVTASKIRFLKRLFDDLRLKTEIHFIFTEHGETKSQAINDHEIRYHSFVDDLISNIHDVIANTDSREKEFLIPRYGYNIRSQEVSTMASMQDSKVLWFDNDLVLKDKILYDTIEDYSDFDRFKLNWSLGIGA
jgi:hypothetical protein